MTYLFDILLVADDGPYEGDEEEDDGNKEDHEDGYIVLAKEIIRHKWLHGIFSYRLLCFAHSYVRFCLGICHYSRTYLYKAFIKNPFLSNVHCNLTSRSNSVKMNSKSMVLGAGKKPVPKEVRWLATQCEVILSPRPSVCIAHHRTKIYVSCFRARIKDSGSQCDIVRR